MENAVIVAMGRSAMGRANKGSFKDTRPEDLGAQVLTGVLKQIPNLDQELIDDVIVGCAFPEAEQGMNMAKVVAAKANLPQGVSGQTVNRFCSSGLQTIATAANAIMAKQAKVIVAGGIESMSTIPMGGNQIAPDPTLMSEQPSELTTMGITAENVAAKYEISRNRQDQFAAQSHERALKARDNGTFASEIIPVTANYFNPQTHQFEAKIVDTDEGIRPGTTAEGLAKLRPVFKADGSVTAANSSQMTDGAAFVVVMAESLADELGLKPIARFVSFATAGVPADLMGLGPIKAIPKALDLAKLNQDDIDLIELNEAFAAQSIACIDELGLDESLVNVNGGAISLGHPLGCTGAFLTIKVLNELKRRNQKYGLVSMCIGGGMGAAGIFELI